MEFDDQDEQEEEMGPPASYEQVSNSSPPRPGNSSLGRKSGAGAGSRYRECLKNHAVGIGGHAVDGCGEFMAAGEEGTLDALKCAACHCHRNFHRKEIEREGVGGGVLPQLPFSPYYRTPTNAGYFHVAPHYRPPTLALPSTSGGGCGREDQEDISNLVGGLGVSSGKKRNRTKFTQEQKEKMLDFAEKVGWRIQKQDEAAVQEFCAETCVKRHVLKVWMHNNKHTLGKKP